MMKLHLSAAMLFFIFTNTAFSQQGHRTEWTMINGDAQQTAYAKMDLDFPLQFRASFQMLGFRESGMTYKDGQVYVMGAGSSSDENTLIAFDLDIGSTRIWDYPIPGTGATASFVPAISGDLILGSGQGADMLYSFSRQTGEVAWIVPSHSFFTRSPVVNDTHAYYGMDSVYAVSLLSGATGWTYPESIPQISPVLYGDTVYLGNDNGIIALNATSGDLIWRNDDVTAQHYTSFAVDNSRLYIGNLHDLAVLDRMTGVSDWGQELPQGHELTDYPGGMCLTDDHLVLKLMNATSQTTNYVVLDKISGTTLADWEVPVFEYMGPTLINDMLVEIKGDSLLFFDLMTGERQYGYEFGEFSPNADQILAADDYLFIGGFGSILVLEPMPTNTTVPAAIKAEFDCTPNPFTNDLEILLTMDQNAEVEIFLTNAQGTRVRDIFTGNITTGITRININTSALPQGAYTVTALVNDRQMLSQMAVKTE